MKYIVYLTTNTESQINGTNKIYVGVHQTENPEIFDGYIGCGVYVNQPSTYMYPKTPFQFAVKKYGTKAFKRSVLFVYDIKEEAYKKEGDIVNHDFIKMAHVYNVCLGGIANNNGIPLYQYDLDGNLIKRWEFSSEAFEYFGIFRDKFHAAIYGKYKFLNCYWSYNDNINVDEYLTIPKIQEVYVYNKEGKLIKYFDSEVECAKWLNLDTATINHALTRNSLVNKQYYLSKKVVDEFKPKARKEWQTYTYYVYKNNEGFVGKFVGKEVMSIINLHSWGYIRDVMQGNKGWYKDFYLSLEEKQEIPSKKLGHGNSIEVDVYDKFGQFIETVDSVKTLKKKYNARSVDVKNIMYGKKYFKDFIFVYHKL